MAIRRIVPNFEADPAAADDFYCGLLEMKVAMDRGWIKTFADPNDGNQQISLLTADRTAPVVADVSIEVDDVDAVYARAVEQGREIVHPLTDEDWGVRRFFVRDPAGRVVNVLAHS